MTLNHVIGQSHNIKSTNHDVISNRKTSTVMSKLSTKPKLTSTGSVQKSPDELRAERLRLQKLKQEQFRQRIQQQKMAGEIQSSMADRSISSNLPQNSGI